MLLKIAENVDLVSNSLDLEETLLGVSSGSRLFALITLVVVGGLRVTLSTLLCVSYPSATEFSAI